MKALFKLLSGFVSDQNGNGSRKAMALYASLFFLYMQIQANINNPDKAVDPYLIGANMIIILFCLGAISAEWITKNWNPGDKPPQP